MVLTKLIARFKSKLDATTAQLFRPSSQCVFGALTLGRLRDTRDTGGPRRMP